MRSPGAELGNTPAWQYGLGGRQSIQEAIAGTHLRSDDSEKVCRQPVLGTCCKQGLEFDMLVLEVYGWKTAQRPLLGTGTLEKEDFRRG